MPVRRHFFISDEKAMQCPGHFKRAVFGASIRIMPSPESGLPKLGTNVYAVLHSCMSNRE